MPCTYPLLERVKLEIAAAGGVIRDTEYAADIRLTAAFPEGGAERFAPRLTELSAGGLAMEEAGQELLRVPGRRSTEFLRAKRERTNRSLPLFCCLQSVERSW